MITGVDSLAQSIRENVMRRFRTRLVSSLTKYAAVALLVAIAPFARAQTQPPGVIVYFATASDSFSENAGTVQIRVQLSAPSTSVVTVDYQTNATAPPPPDNPNSVQADAGTDYQTLQGQLTFDPGDTVKYIALTLLDDQTSEPAQFVALDLSNPSGASLSTDPAYPSRHYVNIVDDDNPSPPVAVDDEGSIDDDGSSPASGNVLTNDYNPGGGSITVCQVNGLSANVGMVVAGTYGNLTINSDGSYTYALNYDSDAVIALQEDVPATDHFTYAIANVLGLLAYADADIVVNPKRKRMEIDYAPITYTKGQNPAVYIKVVVKVKQANTTIKLKFKSQTGTDVDYATTSGGMILTQAGTPIKSDGNGNVTVYVPVDQAAMVGVGAFFAGRASGGGLDSKGPTLPAFGRNNVKIVSP